MRAFIYLRSYLLFAVIFFILTVLSLIAFFDTSTVNAENPSFNLAVMSDSSSDEYRANDNRAGGTQWATTTLAWTELLEKYRNINLGPWGNRAEPRRSGYEYNWARTGAEAQDVVTTGQHTGIAQQTQSGLIDLVYFQIGNNDFAYYRDGADIYSGAIAGQALQNKINDYLDDVETALDTVLSANGEVKVILGTVADPGNVPYWQSQFPDPAKRQRLVDALVTTNNGIKAMAASRPRVILFDQEIFATELLSRVDQNGSLIVGNEAITLITNGNEPHHALLADNIHAGTVMEGIFANKVIELANTALSTQVATFSDNDLLINAGILTASPTPNTIPTMQPSASPTVTPTTSPTLTPSPTPVVETMTLQVNTSTDDMYQMGSSNYLTNPTVAIGGDSAYYAGLRFTNVAIPQGATIRDAYVEVYTPNQQWISIGYEIYAENTGNSATFSTSNRPGARPSTQNKVSHSSSTNWLANTWQKLPSITSSIQEVINRSDWSTSNAISVLLHGTGTTYGRKFVTSYNGNVQNAPKLIIEYEMLATQPTPTPTQAPTLTPTPTITPTPSPVSTPTTIPSDTPTPISTPTPTATPTATPIPTLPPTPTPPPAVRTISITSRINGGSQIYMPFDGIIEDSSAITEVTSNRFTYSSGWTYSPNQGRNNSPFRYTTTNGRTITFSTSAQSLSLMTIRSPQTASFDVYVNSVFKFTYNTTSSNLQYVDVNIPLE